jgi:MazG family protein
MNSDPGTAASQFHRLVNLVSVLRSPEGCPWDREQTLESLRPFVLEETYEVLEAIDNGDIEALRHEIGDLIFEGVLLAQVCAENGQFSVAEALQSVNDKLVRRHPHVFGPGGTVEGSAAAALHTPAEVLERWEALKARERAAAGGGGLLSGVPKVLPSLLRAFEMGSRAATVGFDWDRAVSVIAKIEEEVGELRQAVESGDSAARTEEEMGDLLFAVANLSRKLGIEPEAALRRANDKFARRFPALERRFERRGESLPGASLEAMEAEWALVKEEEA